MTGVLKRRSCEDRQKEEGYVKMEVEFVATQLQNKDPKQEEFSRDFRGSVADTLISDF